MAELLTPSIAYAYNQKAKALPYNGMQDIGERRRLRQDLQERCGITELEAINILNGFHIDTYCIKYLRKALRQQAIKQREREGELLNNIAYLADLETAEAAADIYAAKKHAYSFDGYLHQLEKLKTVLAAGVPPETALEAVDSCVDADTIIKYYRGGTA